MPEMQFPGTFPFSFEQNSEKGSSLLPSASEQSLFGEMTE